MGQADRLTLDVGPEQIQIAGNGYFAPKLFSRSLLDNEIARINGGAQKTIDDFTDILNNPDNPFYNHPGLSRSVSQSQIDQAKSQLLDINNLDEGTRVMLANNIISNEGLSDEVNAARDDFVGSQKSQAFNKFARVAGPALLAFGGAAFGPALFGAGGAAASGGAASGAATSSSLGALGNFAANQALYGAASGGLGGYLSGGDLSSALKGAALGGVTGGYGGEISSALGGGTLGQTVAGGLQKAAGPLGAGDYKGAALAGALGGGESYLNAGGSIPGLGTKAGAPLTNGMQGPTQGTGVIGSLTRATTSAPTQSFVGNLTGGNMNLSSLLKPAAAAYGAYSARETEDEMKDLLLRQQEESKNLFDPYNQAGQEANQQLSSRLSDGYQFEEDPGYQFQLNEGQRALDRTQAARGGLYSGAALKEALGFSQGLADQTYNDGYNRYLSQNNQLAGQAGQGIQAAGALGQVNNNIGDIQANSTLTRNNIEQQLLSRLLGGDSFLGGF